MEDHINHSAQKYGIGSMRREPDGHRTVYTEMCSERKGSIHEEHSDC